MIVSSDLCFDITAAVTPLVADFPGVAMAPQCITSQKERNRSQIVADCSATDATTISNAVTGEVWIRKDDGSFEKISD